MAQSTQLQHRQRRARASGALQIAGFQDVCGRAGLRRNDELESAGITYSEQYQTEVHNQQSTNKLDNHYCRQ
jgi:hypothetical protein